MEMGPSPRVAGAQRAPLHRCSRGAASCHAVATCFCADCKDLDAACEAWANNNECTNNVAYMIGAGQQEKEEKGYRGRDREERSGRGLPPAVAADPPLTCRHPLAPRHAGTKDRPGHCIKSW